MKHPFVAALAFALSLTLALATSSATAADQPNPNALERSLAGHWRGALEYRDYQSNRKFELPMDTRISTGPDNATLTRLTAFDDGPQTGTVYITSVSLFDVSGSKVTHATFRKGRAVESWTEEARVTAWQDATHWTLVYQYTGTDDNKPAEIRATQSRDGDVLTTLKEVRPVGAPDSAFVFRNQTRLLRVAASAAGQNN